MNYIDLDSEMPEEWKEIFVKVTDLPALKGGENRKALLLDRDGVLNENVTCIVSLDRFNLLPGIGPALKKAQDAGYLLILITNQPDISKGFYSFEDLHKIHKKLRNYLLESGVNLAAIYTCPTHPDSGFDGEIVELKYNSWFRKPGHGLLEQAIKDYCLNRSLSYMIGDNKSDMLAAEAAQVKGILVSEKIHDINVDPFVCSNILEAVDSILLYNK